MRLSFFLIKMLSMPCLLHVIHGFVLHNHRHFGDYDHGMLYDDDEDKAVYFDNIVCYNDFYQEYPGLMKLILDLDNLKLKEEKNFPAKFVNSDGSVSGYSYGEGFSDVRAYSFTIPCVKYYPAEHSYTDYDLDIKSMSVDGNKLNFDIVSKGKLWGENRDKCSISKVSKSVR